MLLGVSKNARLEEHDGGECWPYSVLAARYLVTFPCDPSGHFVPSKGNWRKFLVNYMKDPLAPYVSPTASSAVARPSMDMAEASGNASYKSALTMKL